MGMQQNALPALNWEKMLPVVFEPPDADQNEEHAERRFHDQLVEVAGSDHKDILVVDNERHAEFPCSTCPCFCAWMRRASDVGVAKSFR